LLKVKGEQGEFLSLTDLQLNYDANMDRRLAAYAALAREKYRLEVHVAVVYLRPPPEGKSVAKAFHSEFMGQTAHQDFHTVCLWELDAEAALALNNPALIPFVPLMKGGNTAHMLRRCVAKAQEEPNAQEVEMALALFASIVMKDELIKQIVGWSMNILKESPLYQELTALAREEGREEGREEERLAHLQTLQRLISYRYGVTSDYFGDQLHELDSNVIKRLTNVAFDLETLQEFERAVAEHAQPSSIDVEFEKTLNEIATNNH